MITKSSIKGIKFLLLSKLWQIINTVIFFKKTNYDQIIFVSEKANWAIKNVGKEITKRINKRSKNLMHLTLNPERMSNKILHFGSHYMWSDWYRFLPKTTVPDVVP